MTNPQKIYAVPRVGMTVWKPVTDHPQFVKRAVEGDPYLFTDPEVAQKIATAWNSYLPDDFEWKWYVKTFELMPRTNTPLDEIGHESQLSFAGGG